jgi:hypothetical protein
MAIGNPITLTSNVASKTISVIATAEQTLFTVTGGYRINQLSVFRNGVRLLDGRDYDARNGSTVTLLSAATVGDALEFQVFDDFRVADAIVSAESEQTIQGNLTVAGILTATNLSVTDLSLRHLSATGISTFSDTTQSTSTTTGALIISGGVGIAKSLFVGGDMSVAGTLTYEDVTNVETAGITTTGGLVVTGLGATFGSISTHFSNIEFGAAGVGGTITPLGHAEFVGVVTASSFSGDGSGLTGVASTDNINTSTLAQFTGGVGIADSIFHIGDSNNAIRFPAADTFTVTTAGNERLRVNSSGLVGVNTDSPGRQLTVSGGSAEGVIQITNNTSGGAAANGFELLHFTSGETQLLNRENGAMRFDTNGTERLRITAAGRVRHQNSGGETIHEMQRTDSNTTGAVGTINFTASDDHSVASLGAVGDGDNEGAHIIFRTTSAAANNSPFNAATPERLRIDSSGRLLLGTGGLSTDQDAVFQVSSTSFGVAQIFRTGSAGSALHLSSTTGTLASPAALANGDHAGYLSYRAYDGAAWRTGANIGAAADGQTWASGDCPTRLVFATTADSGTSPTERLRINSSGAIGVSGANFGSSGQVLTSNGSGSAVTWEDASGGISTQAGTASGIVTSMFLTDATDHKVTATGICTITTTQSGTEGQSHTIRVVNSGIATVGFSTYFLFPSGSAPSLPTADGAVSLISFTVHDSVGAGCTQLLAGVSVNFS